MSVAPGVPGARDRGTPGARPSCAACGGILGVYEKLHWRRPDGSVVTCGWLEARADERHAHPASAFFHAGCALADTGSA